MEGNLLGVIYKGGFIVPGLVAINIIIVIFSIERLVTLLLANGKGKTDKFIAQIKGFMDSKDFAGAIAAPMKGGLNPWQSSRCHSPAQLETWRFQNPDLCLRR